MPTTPASYTVLMSWDFLADPGPAILRASGCELLVLSESRDKAELDHLLGTRPVDAVISRSLELDAAALRSCPTLKVISKHGTGVNNIDVATATELGIPVTSTPGANAASVAELTIGLMIAAARRIAWLDRQAKEGHWRRVQDGLQLRGRTLGLVGFGEVAQRVATVAMALGMNVVAVDPAIARLPVPAGVGVRSRLEDVLAVADVLSLHVPLTGRTRGLIGREQLALLPEGAILLNTARGPVVDEPALVEALRSGALRAAGLDTLVDEPAVAGHPLAGLDNVVLTPHVGGSTTASISAVAAAAAENVIAVLGGHDVDPRCQVNPEVFAQGSGVRV